MTSPATPALPVPAQRAEASRRRFTALVRLLDARARTRFGAQLARLFAVLATLGYGVALPFAARGHGAVAVVGNAVRMLSWIAGGAIALSLAGRFTADDEAVAALARQRGYGSRTLAWAAFFVGARRTLGVVGVPAVLLALEALAVSFRAGALVQRGLLLLGVAIYVVVLSLCVAILVQLGKSLATARARWIIALLVLLPEVLRSIFPTVPSVPHLLGSLLDQVMVLGGRG